METTVHESDGEGSWIAYRIKSGEIVYFINEKTKECKWPGVDGDGSSSSREPFPVCCNCVIKVENDRNIWDHVLNIEEAKINCASPAGQSDCPCCAANETVTNSSTVDNVSFNSTANATYGEDHCHTMSSYQVPKDVSEKQSEKSHVEVGHLLSENTSKNGSNMGTAEREKCRLSVKNNPVMTARVRRLKEIVQKANSKYNISPLSKNVQLSPCIENDRAGISSGQECERSITAETVAPTLQGVIQDRSSREARINSDETEETTRIKCQFLEESPTHKPSEKDSLPVSYEAALASLLDNVQERLSQDTNSAGGSDTILESEKDLKLQSLCNTLSLASKELHCPTERNIGQVSFVEQVGNGSDTAECNVEITLTKEGAQKYKGEESNGKEEEHCNQAVEMNVEHPENIHRVSIMIKDIEPETDLNLPSPKVVPSQVELTTKSGKIKPNQHSKHKSLSVSSMEDPKLKALKAKTMPCRVRLVDIMKQCNVETSKHRKQSQPNELLLGNFPLLDCTRIRMQPLSDLNCEKSSAGNFEVINMTTSSPANTVVNTGTDNNPSNFQSRAITRTLDRVVTCSVKATTATSGNSVSNPDRETTETISGFTSSSTSIPTEAAASALRTQDKEITGTTEVILSSQIFAANASIDSSLGTPARGTTTANDCSTSCLAKLTAGITGSIVSSPVMLTETVDSALSSPVKLTGTVDSALSSPAKLTGTTDSSTSSPVKLTTENIDSLLSSPVELTGTTDSPSSSPVKLTGTTDSPSSSPIKLTGTTDSPSSSPVELATETIDNPLSSPVKLPSGTLDSPLISPVKLPSGTLGSPLSVPVKLTVNPPDRIKTRIQCKPNHKKKKQKRDQCASNLFGIPWTANWRVHDCEKDVCFPVASSAIEISRQQKAEKEVRQFEMNAAVNSIYLKGDNVNPGAEITYPDLEQIDIASTTTENEKPKEPSQHHAMDSPRTPVETTKNPASASCKTQKKLICEVREQQMIQTETASTKNASASLRRHCPTCHCSGNFEQPSLQSVSTQTESEERNKGISEPMTLQCSAESSEQGVQSKSVGKLRRNSVSTATAGGNVNTDATLSNLEVLTQVTSFIDDTPGDKPFDEQAKYPQHLLVSHGIAPVATTTTYQSTDGVCTFNSKCSTQPGSRRTQLRATKQQQHLLAPGMKSVPKTVLCPDPIGQAQVGSNELPASMQHPSLFEPNKNINKPSVSRVLKIGQLVLGKSGNQSDSTGIQIVAKQQQAFNGMFSSDIIMHQSSTEYTDHNSKTNKETDDAMTTNDTTNPCKDSFSQCVRLVRNCSLDHTNSGPKNPAQRNQVDKTNRKCVSAQMGDNNCKGNTRTPPIPDDCKVEVGMEVSGVLYRDSPPDIVSKTNCTNNKLDSKDKNQAGKNDIAGDGNENRSFEATSLQDGSTTSTPLSCKELYGTFAVVGRHSMHGESEAGQNTSTTMQLHEFVTENQCNAERASHQDICKQNSLSQEQTNSGSKRSSNNDENVFSRVTIASSAKRNRSTANKEKETSQKKVAKASVNTKKNQRARSQKGFKCEFCKKILKYATHFVRHLRTHTGEKPYRCELCGKEFSIKGSLDRHQRSHKDTVTYHCKYCDESFTDRDIHKQHLRSHTQAPMYKCDKCGKEFKRLCTLNEHKVIHVERSYKCPSCSKRFLHALSLERHLQAHKEDTTKKKTFDCTFCNKSFKRRDSLTRHLRIHNGEKPFECQFCNKKFVDWSGRQVHVRSHTGEKPYECDICKKAFAQSSMLTIHRRSHSGEKPYKCQTCSLAFASSGNLGKHTMIHTRERPFPCEFCGRRFQRAFDLTRHQQGRDQRSGSCPDLPDSARQLKFATVSPEISNDTDVTNSGQTVQLKNKPQLISSTNVSEVISGGCSDPLATAKHGHSTIGDSVASTTATVVSVQISEMQAQMEEESCFTAVQQSAVKSDGPSEVESHQVSSGKGKETEERPRCVAPVHSPAAHCETDKRKTVKFAPEEAINTNTPCKASFHSVREVEAEFYPKMGKYGYDKQLICKYCRRMFDSNEALQEHAPVHVAPKKYHCKYCEKTFTYCTSLNQHLSRHLPEKKHECQFCKKRFSVTGDLKRHLLTHTGVKPFKCHVCPKAFTQRGNLSSHLRLHDGNRCFPCDLCDKKFYQSTHLRQHRRTHTGEKPHHCSLCDKSFVCGTHLKRHLRMHTGEKPYKCEYCDMRFVDCSARASHRRKHTGEKPFECQTCGKRFTESSQLKIHVRSHTKYKPHKCEHCNKCFATTSARAKHTHLHFGKRPFRCEFCSRGFVTSEEIAKHMKFHEKAKAKVTGNE